MLIICPAIIDEVVLLRKLLVVIDEIAVATAVASAIAQLRELPSLGAISLGKCLASLIKLLSLGAISLENCLSSLDEFV